MPIDDVVSAVAEWKPRQKALTTYRDYYDGRHQLRFATPDFQSKYGGIVGSVVMSIRENLCPAAVTAFTDGIEVESWGIGEDADESVEQGLSRLEAMVNREAYTTGDAFVLVWAGSDGQPTASFQPSAHMVPVVDEVQPDQLRSCAKVWIDHTRHVGRVNIYTDRGVERWETTAVIGKDANAGDLPDLAAGWQGCTDEEGDWIAHDMGAVPVCWFKREAITQTGRGSSVLDDVIPLQDALNKSLADMIVTSEGYARPFWYLLNFASAAAPANPLLSGALPHGMPPLDVGVGGVPTNATPPGVTARRFDPTRQRIFTHDGPGPFGQLEPPDLTRLQGVQDGFAMKIARVVGVPSYYFTQTSGDVPSGESLRVLSQRRTNRIRAWQRDAGPVWRGVKQLLGMGDDPVEWAPAMQLDELEQVQVAESKHAMGWPLADVARDLGEPDPEGLAARASASRQQTAREFMNGVGASTYGG